MVMKIVSQNGYNALASQTQVTTVHFKTSNGSSCQAGTGGGNFYGDMVAVRCASFSAQSTSPYCIRAVQTSTTSYDFYASFNGYLSTGSFYKVDAGQSTWTNCSAFVVAATGTYLDKTPVSSGRSEDCVFAGTNVTSPEVCATTRMYTPELRNPAADPYLDLLSGCHDSGYGGIHVKNCNGQGKGYLYWAGTNYFGLLHCAGGWALKLNGDTSVYLYYNNALKLQTTAAGVTVTGGLCGTTAVCSPIICGSSWVCSGGTICGATLCAGVVCATNYVNSTQYVKTTRIDAHGAAGTGGSCCGGGAIRFYSDNNVMVAKLGNESTPYGGYLTSYAGCTPAGAALQLQGIDSTIITSNRGSAKILGIFCSCGTVCFPQSGQLYNNGVGYFNGRICANGDIVPITNNINCLGLGDKFWKCGYIYYLTSSTVRASSASWVAICASAGGVSAATCVTAPIVCGTSCLRSNVLHAPGDLCIYADGQHTMSFWRSGSDDWAEICCYLRVKSSAFACTCVRSPHICGTTAVCSPIVCATSKVRTSRINDNCWIGCNSISITCSTWVTGATVCLNAHEGGYLKVVIAGDWNSHSSIGYMAEFFIQDGANGYSQPGSVIREVTNQHNSDYITARICDPGAATTPRQYLIQFQTVVPGSNTTAAGVAYYDFTGRAQGVS